VGRRYAIKIDAEDCVEGGCDVGVDIIDYEKQKHGEIPRRHINIPLSKQALHGAVALLSESEFVRGIEDPEAYLSVALDAGNKVANHLDLPDLLIDPETVKITPAKNK